MIRELGRGILLLLSFIVAWLLAIGIYAALTINGTGAALLTVALVAVISRFAHTHGGISWTPQVTSRTGNLGWMIALSIGGLIGLGGGLLSYFGMPVQMAAPIGLNELLSKNGPLFLIFLLALAFIEELAFRGVIQPAISRYLGIVPAIALTSAMFIAMHLPNEGFNQLWPVIAALSLVCSVYREITQSVKTSLLAHLAYNALAVGPFIFGLNPLFWNALEPPLDLLVLSAGLSAISVALVVSFKRRPKLSGS